MLISKYLDLNLVKVFKSLADAMRLRIIRILMNGTFNVNEIQFIVNGKQSNISHHLKVLQESGIVISKKEGSLIYYRLNELALSKSLEKILELLNLNIASIPSYDDDSRRLDAIQLKRKKNAEDFFNSVGKGFDDMQEELFNDIYSIDDALGLLEEKLGCILDIGCGTGRNLPSLAKYSKKIIGVDSSPVMLQLSDHICKTNNLNYELKLSDIMTLPFDPESMDGVLLNMVLHHISNPSGALKEISRITRKNGKLLLIELLSHDYEIMRNKYADMWLGFSIEDLTGWINANGFIINKQLKKKSGNTLNNYRVIIILASKKLEVIEKK